MNVTRIWQRVLCSRKTKRTVAFLTSHMETHDVPPSFDEMRDALGLASKSGIHRLVSGLEERGYIRRLANRARLLIFYARPMLGVRLPVR